MKKSIISIYSKTGEYAIDKDVARELRGNTILPAVTKNEYLCLDFSEIKVTTQSFIHAAISEAVRKFGKNALNLIEFHGCNKGIQSIIETVVNYSWQFLDDAQSKLKDVLVEMDVPQADRLESIRDVLAEIGKNTNKKRILKNLKLSERHLSYKLQAARILGFIEKENSVLTDLGSGLIRTVPGSEEETSIFVESIATSSFFKVLVPDLFDDVPPSRDIISRRLVRLTNLSRVTAERRAGTILSWRKQLVDKQYLLPFE